MSDYSEPSDPTAHLTKPDAHSIDLAKELRASAGTIAGTLDGIIAFITGTSPLEEWVAQPFAGDWNGIAVASQAWRNAGSAFGCLSSNLTSVAGDVDDDWKGAAATAFVQELRNAAEELGRYPSGCEGIAQLCDVMIEQARAAANAIAAAIGVMVDIAVEFLAYVSIPVGGEVAIAVRIPFWGVIIIKTGIQATSTIRRLYQAIDTFKKVMDIIKPLVESLVQIRNAAEAGRNQIVETRQLVAAAFG